MPLHNGERFHRIKPPSSLKPDDEVFFCPVTLEIFRDYDEYFERTISVNSAAWHCAVCGRGPISYVQAVQCETADTRHLNTYDSSLATGLLHIIQAAKCKRLPDLVELLCNFASNRFFIGELVEFTLNKAKHPGTVRQVYLCSGRNVQPNSRGAQRSESNGSSNSSICSTGTSANPGGLPSVNQVVYCITDNRRTDGTSSIRKSSITPLYFPARVLQRRGGCHLTREKTRYFIRYTCELSDGCFVPKTSIAQRYGLHPHGPLTWRDLYLLPEPNWLDLMKYYNSLNVSVNRPIVQSLIKSASHLSAGVTASRRPLSSTCYRQLLPKPPDSANLVRSGSWQRQGDAGQAVTTTITKEDMIRVQRAEMERDWLSVRRREDLELSDLVPLPDIPLFPTKLPASSIGPAFQLFEFFHIFGPVLELYIPKKTQTGSKTSLLSWPMLEEALVNDDPCGPLADIFISLLLALRHLDVDFTAKRTTLTIPPATYSAASTVAAAEVGAPFNLPVISSGSSSDSSNLFDDLILAPGGISSSTIQLLRNTGSAARLNELVGIPYLFTWSGASRSAQTLQQQLNEFSNSVRKDDSTPVGPSKMSYSRAVTLAALCGTTSLCTLDRLGLSTALQLYLSTSGGRGGCCRGQTRFCMRPLDDPAFMFCRENGSLLEKLKNVSVYDLTVDEKLILLNCLVDQLLLHPIIRDRVDERAKLYRLICTRLRQVRSDHPTGKSTPITQSGDLNSLSSTGIITETKLSANPSSHGCTDASPSSIFSNKEVGALDAKSSYTSNVEGARSAKDLCELDSLPNDEQHLLEKLIEASRGSSMLPLGQDRFCRHYWLLLSVPCILVEDTPLSAEHPLATSPILLSKQLSAFHPSLADIMALNSNSLATVRLREFVAKHPHMDRETITQHLCVRLPNESSDDALTTEQLKMLVYPERVTEADLPTQTKSASATQTHNIRVAHQKLSPGSSIWSILTPFDGPLPPIMAIKVEPDNATSQMSEKSAVSANNVSTQSENSLDERAAWTIDSLEAGLNPRGVRESRLRRIIGELRPLLIRVVASCPPELMRSSQATSSSEQTPIKATSGFWSKPTTHESGRKTDVILLNWLELSLRRMATRLGLRDVMHDCFITATKNASTEVQSQVYEDCKPGVFASGVGLTRSSRLEHLARTLLLFGQAIGPKAVLGPLGHDSRTARVVPVSDPGVSTTSSPVVPNLTGSRGTTDSLCSDGSTSPMYFTTTGWERWCAHVAQAQSASQVYLLARSLERGLRRMLLFGNRLRLNIPRFERGGYLPPKLRCTACRFPQDSSEKISSSNCPLALAQPTAVTHSRFAYVPFCACAGCGAPFHLDCLLDSGARTRRTTGLRRQPDRPHHPSLNTRVLQNSGIEESDIRSAVGYISLQSPLANQTVMRAEAGVGSLYLCCTCTRVAGKLSSPNNVPNNHGTEEEQTFTGDEEWSSLSDDSIDRNLIESFTKSTDEPPSDPNEANIALTKDRKCKRTAEGPSHLTPRTHLRSDDESSTSGDTVPNKRTRQTSSVLRDNNFCSVIQVPSQYHGRQLDHRNQAPRDEVAETSSSSCLAPVLSDHPIELSRVSEPETDSDSDSLKEIMMKFPTLKRVSVVLHPCDLANTITNVTSLRNPMARRGRPISRRLSAKTGRSYTGVSGSSIISNTGEPTLSHSSSHAIDSPELDNSTAKRLLNELCDSPLARPLLRCGVGRSPQGVLTEQNMDSSDELHCSSADNISPRKVLPVRARRRPTRLDPEPEPVREQLRVWDLNSLRELVVHDQLPGGPEVTVHQLRLLIKHWLLTNRPESRIHQSALAVSALLNSKLADLGYPVNEQCI